MALTIHGTVSLGFEPVADAFRENFTARGEIGATVSVWHRGAQVVHLWAGQADVDTGRPWSRDTLGVVFSATKGLVAIAFLMLEDRGLLDLDMPVVDLWPELAGDGRDGITVRTLLNHRSGLSAVDEPLTLDDFADLDRVDAVLARQRPLWAPGTDQGYGATAWGMYTQAIFRRVTGETVGRFLAREVTGPLGADTHLGLPPGHDARVATLYPVPPSELVRVVLPQIVLGNTLEGRVYRRVLFQKGSDSARAFRNPDMGPTRFERLNEPAVRALELPWMNALSTAEGLGRIYAALAQGGALDGVRLVSPEAIARVAPKQSWAHSDRMLVKPLGFSQGFVKDEPHLFTPHEAAFGHPGAGGAVGLADPTRHTAIAYVMNRMDHRIRSPRALALCHAVTRAVDGFR